MKFIKKRKSVLIFSIAFLIFVLGLFQNPITSMAQIQFSDESLTFDSKFTMLESSDENGEKLNANSINITLPSSTWNVTALDLNFTSIKLGRETKIIEDQGKNEYEEIDWNKPRGWGIQINITELTTIFGVDLYGYIELDGEILPTIDVNVQIRGNGPGNVPNETVYGSENINFGQIPRWYLQTFSKPVNLSKGYYYLVINGSDLDLSDQTKYLWRINESGSLYSNLQTSKLDASWANTGSGKVFWHKFIQRVNRSYTPEVDIDMGVEFSGTVYNVTKGSNPYTGNVTIPLNDYSPGTAELYLPIIHNLSIIELLVNYTYSMSQKNFLISSGSALVKDSVDNHWSVTPNIFRTDGIYSVEFEYPDTWKNPSVFKDSQNITDDLNVTIAGNKIIIANDIITQGASWNITAYSSNINFDATVPTTLYAPGQTIKVTATPPAPGGNFTYILVDPYGLEEYRDMVEDPQENELLESTLPINPTGQWKVYVLWNNQTDAGLQILTIQVNVVAAASSGGGGGGTTVVTGIDPLLIFMVILYMAIASIAGLSSYKMVKRHKRIKSEHREKVFNKYMDLLNLDYIMIIDKKSGLSIHDQILAGKERDSTLISGFLEAIRTFGIDLTGSEDESQTISLQYQNMNIIMNDFKNFRILNIMKESPSQDFLDSLRPLSHDIDTYYGKSLKDFDGNVSKFKGIKDLLETHLQTPLIYPLKVVKSKEIKLNSAEKSLTNKAQNMMKKNKTEHFYVSHLMGTSKEFNVKNAEIILNLIEKKVFRPIE